MWVLMYIFSYSISPATTNDKEEWRLLPTVVFQEFSTEQRDAWGQTRNREQLEGSRNQAKKRTRSFEEGGKRQPGASHNRL